MIPFHKWLWPPIMSSYERIDSWIESVGIDALFAYNRAKIHAWLYYDHIYTEYPVARALLDIFGLVLSLPIMLVQSITYARVEPLDSSVSIYHTTFQPQNPTTPELTEVGNVQNQSVSSGKPFWVKMAAHWSNSKEHNTRNFMGELESALIASKTIESICETGIRDVMVLARQNPWYFVLCPDSPMPVLPPKKSHVEFFVVQYMNDGMKSPVHLHVPEHMFYVGNMLFRPAFVLWLLEQEPLITEYVFNEHYTLTIMDQNIEERHLSSEQYLVLGEDDYVVVRK